MNSRHALAALLILSTHGVVAGGEWEATGGLRPDSGRGVHTTTLAVDPGIGLIYAGSDTGTVYRRDEATLAQPPVVQDDEGYTMANTPVAIAVLANDHDPNGSLLPETVTIVEPPVHGFAMAQADGSVLYTPNEGFIGEDGFRYTVTNATGQVSTAALVLVTVEPQILIPTPDDHDFGTHLTGTMSDPIMIEVVNGNDFDDPVRIGTLTTAGDSDAFEVVDDGCSGMYLEIIASCTLSVRYLAPAPGSHSVRLGFAGALIAIELTGDTVAAPTSLSIDDVRAAEGNVGNTDFMFTVVRSHTLHAVTVQVDTVDGTATAGSDYEAITGQTLTLPAGGPATATVTIQVAGDTVLEPDEIFFVNLSNATGATIADGQGTGAIENDDAANVAIDNARLAEGDNGVNQFVFTLKLEGSVQDGFQLPWATRDGTATAGSDYTAGSGMLSFSGSHGETRRLIIAVAGDLEPETDEDFFIDLGAATVAGVTAHPTAGTGVIVNDDLYADVSVAIDNGHDLLLPGQVTIYTLTVHNTSTVIDLPQVHIETTLPTESMLGELSWTCSGSGGASCPASGSGLIDQVRALPRGGSLHYVITATVNIVPSLPPPHFAAIAAMATVQPPYEDPNPANNSAIDSDPLVDILFADGFEDGL